VAVGVGVDVGVDVLVWVGVVVAVAVFVAVWVEVGVEVLVAVAVAVFVGVEVGVSVAVLVDVAVGVLVEVEVAVAVAVGVSVTGASRNVKVSSASIKSIGGTSTRRMPGIETEGTHIPSWYAGGGLGFSWLLQVAFPLPRRLPFTSKAWMMSRSVSLLGAPGGRLGSASVRVYPSILTNSTA
jgi:hypothetical protein